MIVLIAVGIIYVRPLIVDPISNPRLDSASAEDRVLYVIFDQMVYPTMEEPRKMMIENRVCGDIEYGQVKICGRYVI